jgi:serine/threonine-protein kinase
VSVARAAWSAPPGGLRSSGQIDYPRHVGDVVVERAQARIGQVLRGKWHLDALIGVGGMAAVYAATHRNGMRGAVKLLHGELGAREDVRERFLREGYAANRVNHAGVVRVLDDDAEPDGTVFLVMDLLAGRTVEALAEARPGMRLPAALVLDVADRLLDVLDAAHGAGIVHRDIKPENLFWTNDGQLKVLDFGIARLLDATNTARATATGTAMGTPAFMSPEQTSGQSSLIDGRTDIYSVGASMFTLLTGRQVHEAETVQLMMARTMTQNAPKLASLAPHLPRAVCVAVDKALAFRREDRWPDARAMQRAVREAKATVGPDVDAQAPPVTQSRGGGAGTDPTALSGVATGSRVEAISVSSSPTASPVSTGARRGGSSRASMLAIGGLLGVGCVATALWFAARSTTVTPSTAAPTLAADAPPGPGTSSSAAPSATHAAPTPPTVEPSAEAAPEEAPTVAAVASSSPSAPTHAAQPKPASTRATSKSPRPASTESHGSRKHEGIF